MLTYRTTVGSAGDGVVLKLQVWVEDIRVEGDAPEEAVANLLPVVSDRARHSGDGVLSSFVRHRMLLSALTSSVAASSGR